MIFQARVFVAAPIERVSLLHSRSFAMPALVSLVGVGPGDPGLLTLRGARAIARADTVLHDALVHPATLRHARDVFTASGVARAAFGDDVVDHYTNMADVELAAFDAAVTDWERYRSFERM